MATEATYDLANAKSSPGVRVVAASMLAHARRILVTDPGLTFVQCSADVEEALRVAQELAPCVLLLGEDALAALKHDSVVTLLERDVRAVVLLPNPDTRRTIDLLRIGYSGVLGVFNEKRVLRRAMRAVSSGEIWASRRVLSELVRDCILSGAPQTLSSVPHKLTPREAEILALIAQGYKNREIAERLFVTRETVRWHERRLYSKLGIVDRNVLLGR
jgi:DNA-binding NarL/FixJ family response regulator